MFKLPHQKKQEVRAAIAPIFDTVIVLGRQGLSFRGHRENIQNDSKYHPEPGGYIKESDGKRCRIPPILCKGWGYTS